jgi:hypothetical protein
VEGTVRSCGSAIEPSGLLSDRGVPSRFYGGELFWC